ncbi:hypothetical protein SKAU_G00090340 [Synaphobranchus kaupii]|uniref:Uncharacterized protein n=1 Tax=Synaphobranchus kaupii TaxID=118154 RepID=A0A9Q1FXF7_SYNKA|nr:hypothetical protein SKAU_G00090340 [Synaphobranchus kaupii]
MLKNKALRSGYKWPSVAPERRLGCTQDVTKLPLPVAIMCDYVVKRETLVIQSVRIAELNRAALSLMKGSGFSCAGALTRS